MNARQFLSTLPTKLGLGCMRFPMITDEHGKETIDLDQSIQMIRHSIDSGAVYIDTAYPYHDGESERIVAKALKDGYREKAILADKMPSWLIKTPDDLEKYFHEQLEKLETHHIDFYMLHALSVSHWANYDKAAVVDFLNALKAKKLVKYVGFSFHDELPLFKEIVDFYAWDFVQIQYNYLDTHYQAGLEGLTYASDKDMAIIVMEPLRGGSLSGPLPKDVEALVHKQSPDMTLTQFAFDYLLKDARVDMVLSGMSNMDQLNENLETFKGSVTPMTDREQANYDQARNIILGRKLVDCTACNYCMPCPYGVKIPQLFRLYNTAHMFDNQAWGKQEFDKHVPREARPDQCIACGACEPKCPQHIPIIEALKQADHYFNR